MNWIMVTALILPAMTASFGLLFWSRTLIQSWIALTGSALLLALSSYLLIQVDQSGILVAQIGNWPAPFGIALVADHFSAIMVLIAGIIGFTVHLYSIAEIDPERRSLGYFPLLNMLLLGVNGAFLAGDIFNLYVWFEVLVISSFVLLGMGRDKEQIRGSVSYVVLNLLASTFLLAGIGIVYGMTGALNFADLSVRVKDLQQPSLLTVAAMFFLVAFGIKAAVFPLFFWLPASYHTPPVAISALYAGLLTKVGVYALIRMFTLIFIQDTWLTHSLLLIISGLTMIVGVLGAVAQTEFRKVLSFHIVSQIGYMILGLAFYTPLGIAGSVFYIVHHIIVKSNLFLVSGVVRTLQGSFELKALGGLYRTRPFLGLLFLIPALSLAGVPPLSGFWAKLFLARAGFQSHQYLLVSIALLVGLLTALSMNKIWIEAFWKPAPPDARLHSQATAGGKAFFFMMAPIVLLASITVILGLNGEFLMSLAMKTSNELLDHTQYVQAVLGGKST